MNNNDVKTGKRGQGAALLIHHEVRPQALDKYESWLRKVIDVAAGFEGHEGVFVFKPELGRARYEIAVRFADEACARRWLESSERRALLEEIRPELLSSDDVEVQPGIDYWFSSPSIPLRQPVRWKQWLLLTLVIWLLALATEPFFNLLFNYIPLPAFLAQGVALAVNVAIVFYLVMPPLVRLTSPWIYRK